MWTFFIPFNEYTLLGKVKSVKEKAIISSTSFGGEVVK